MLIFYRAVILVQPLHSNPLFSRKKKSNTLKSFHVRLEKLTGKLFRNFSNQKINLAVKFFDNKYLKMLSILNGDNIYICH